MFLFLFLLSVLGADYMYWRENMLEHGLGLVY
jgi:hypothetical protein